MDEELRRHEREANLGGPTEIAGWVRAQRRAGAEVTVPRDGDRVRGVLLGALLLAGLGGRREVDLLREAGVPECRIGRRIDAFRRLLRGEQETWSTVVLWAGVLVLDPGDLALVAEVVPVPPRPRREPTPLPVYPAVSCANCVHHIWAVGIGQGVRCGSERGPRGQYGLIPGLRSSCDQFRPRSVPAPSP